MAHMARYAPPTRLPRVRDVRRYASIPTTMRGMPEMQWLHQWMVADVLVEDRHQRRDRSGEPSGDTGSSDASSSGRTTFARLAAVADLIIDLEDLD